MSQIGRAPRTRSYQLFKAMGFVAGMAMCSRERFMVFPDYKDDMDISKTKIVLVLVLDLSTAITTKRTMRMSNLTGSQMTFLLVFVACVIFYLWGLST